MNIKVKESVVSDETLSIIKHFTPYFSSSYQEPTSGKYLIGYSTPTNETSISVLDEKTAEHLLINDLHRTHRMLKKILHKRQLRNLAEYEIDALVYFLHLVGKKEFMRYALYDYFRNDDYLHQYNEEIAVLLESHPSKTSLEEKIKEAIAKMYLNSAMIMLPLITSTEINEYLYNVSVYKDAYSDIEQQPKKDSFFTKLFSSFWK